MPSADELLDLFGELHFLEGYRVPINISCDGTHARDIVLVRPVGQGDAVLEGLTTFLEDPLFSKMFRHHSDRHSEAYQLILTLRLLKLL